MKKIKLNLNDLKIESFETSAKTENRGTVAGNEIKTINFCNNSRLNICIQTIVIPDCFILSEGRCQATGHVCPTGPECEVIYPGDFKPLTKNE